MRVGHMDLRTQHANVTVTVALGALLSASSCVPAEARQRPDDTRIGGVRELARVVFEALHSESADGDSRLSWSNDFFKGADGTVYVPFTLSIDPPKLRTTQATVYVLVVETQAAPDSDGQLPGAPSSSALDELQGPSPPAIAFEAAYFVDLNTLPRDATTAGHRITRAFSVGPGEHDVYVALAESTPASGGAAPDVMLSKQRLSVPDLWDRTLTTSSIVLVDRVEQPDVPLVPDRQVYRDALGTERFVKAADANFRPSDHLNVLFFVYNPGLTAEGLPNVLVDYVFYRREETGEAYVGRSNPQRFNARTMVEFEAAAGQEIMAGHEVSLRSFSEGSYRLYIRITDNTNGSTVVRSVNFNVSGS